MKYKILCYRDHFENFRKITYASVGRIPAKPNDDFARLISVNSEGKIGLHHSEDASKLISLMSMGNYFPSRDKMCCVTEPGAMYGFGYAFRPKCNAFESLIKEHAKFDLDTRKYKVMKRHGRPCAEPTPVLLTPFMRNAHRPIGRKLYKKIIETCHYVTMEAAYEYNSGGFEVFSDNLDFFFDELKDLMGQSGELIYMHHTQLPYEGPL